MQIDHDITIIINSIERFGGEARLVGGCVRDAILERKIHDIDLATNLPPDQVIEALKLSGIKTIPTGLKHGTITAVLNKRSFEITTLRYDVKCDGRHAEVKFTDDWQADASRRDFTFNALYADKHGKIYDYFGGIEDLKARRLNFIGSAEDRIKEDYLRILRAFRFHAKICVGILSNEILNVCEKHAHMLQNLSGERIRDEMFKLLECEDPVSTLNSMKKSNVLQKIIPGEVKCEILSSKLLVKVDVLVKLALLLRTMKSNRLDIGKDVSKFLRLSNKQKKKLLFLLSNNIEVELSENEQKKYISRYGIELYCSLITICGVELESNVDLINQYISFATTFQIPKFPLSGEDLINIGYKPGKDLGKSLELLRQHWENSSYTLTKDELVRYAKTLNLISDY